MFSSCFSVGRGVGEGAISYATEEERDRRCDEEHSDDGDINVTRRVNRAGGRGSARTPTKKGSERERVREQRGMMYSTLAICGGRPHYHIRDESPVTMTDGREREICPSNSWR